jgi:S-adenosylmethionine synthetase
LAGEVKSEAYLDVQKIARDVIAKIGYTKSEYMFDANSCGILSAIHEQSPDINQGVERKNPEDQGAGDQGMMFGYANNETDTLMPLPLMLAHLLLEELAAMRREATAIPYLRPDAKSQVTIQYSDDHKPVNIDTIVISTQHDDFDEDAAMLQKIHDDIVNLLIPRVKAKLPVHIQALFGSKIIVDTYGGRGAHGGGAFSGKDPSKVDRSAAYATRHIAKNLVAAGVCDQALVQVSYAIGVAEPVGLFVDTYGTAKVNMTDGEIAAKILAMPEFSLRPYHIEQRFQLRTPIYLETAAYGHMGRECKTVEKVFNAGKKNEKKVTVKLFPWEETNAVGTVKTQFGL